MAGDPNAAEEPSDQLPRELAVRVNGIAGEICALETDPELTVGEVKADVERLAGIPARDQRLLAGTRELSSTEILSSIPEAAGGGVELTLIRFTEEQRHWLDSVRKDAMVLASAPPHILGDRAVVLEAVEQHGDALQYAAEELWADREVVLAAIQSSSSMLQFAHMTLCSDRNFILDAVHRNGLALAYAPDELRADPEVALLALAEDDEAVHYVARPLWEEAEFTLNALEYTPLALRHAAEELRSDGAFILAALKQTTRALKAADTMLWNDRGFVLAAVRANSAATRFVPKEFWSDSEVAFEMLQQGDPSPVWANKVAWSLETSVPAPKAPAPLPGPRAPAIPEASEAEGPLWEVVGGRESGGIVVRSERNCTSQLVPSRLACGARLKALELAGNRLRYQKLSGQGPDSGWVSLQIEDRELVRRIAPSPSGGTFRAGVPADAHGSAARKDPQRAAHTAGAGAQLEALRQRLQPQPARQGSLQDWLCSHSCFNIITVNLKEDPSEKGTDGKTSGTVSYTSASARFGDTGQWAGRVRSWLKAMDLKVQPRASCCLPPTARQWEPAATVLHVLTRGRFNPPRDVWSAQRGPGTGPVPGLISVVYTTHDSCRAYHPLLLQNFLVQTHERRELVVVHAGTEPSVFFQEKAQEDSRVKYHFFREASPADQSPGLAAGKAARLDEGALGGEDAEEVCWPFGSGRVEPCDTWATSLKRNIGCCIARGAAVAHFEDGCLYGPTYLSLMHQELLQGVDAEKGSADTAVVVVLAQWYSLSISELTYRWVDLKARDPLWKELRLAADALTAAQDQDQWQHGFAHMHTRAAWERQPFRDDELTKPGGGRDHGFLTALRQSGVPVRTLQSPAPYGLAACGWYRDATTGKVLEPGLPSTAKAKEFLMLRGEDLDGAPGIFDKLQQALLDLRSELAGGTERMLEEATSKHGPIFACGFCHFPIARTANVKDASRQMSIRAQGSGSVRSRRQVCRTFDVIEFACAPGAVAHGHSAKVPEGQQWLADALQRAAACRHCGSDLGWRYEGTESVDRCASAGCTFRADAAAASSGCKYCCTACAGGSAGPKGQEHDAGCGRQAFREPEGPFRWGLVWRHLCVFGGDQACWPEVKHGQRGVFCPRGHPLKRFTCGADFGGPLPLNYTCDTCESPAQANQQLWGCSSCDYDVCNECMHQLEKQRARR